MEKKRGSPGTITTLVKKIIVCSEVLTFTIRSIYSGVYGLRTIMNCPRSVFTLSRAYEMRVPIHGTSEFGQCHQNEAFWLVLVQRLVLAYSVCVLLGFLFSI